MPAAVHACELAHRSIQLQRGDRTLNGSESRRVAASMCDFSVQIPSTWRLTNARIGGVHNTNPPLKATSAGDPELGDPELAGRYSSKCPLPQCRKPPLQTASWFKPTPIHESTLPIRILNHIRCPSLCMYGRWRVDHLFELASLPAATSYCTYMPGRTSHIAMLNRNNPLGCLNMPQLSVCQPGRSNASNAAHKYSRATMTEGPVLS